MKARWNRDRELDLGFAGGGFDHDPCAVEATQEYLQVTRKQLRSSCRVAFGFLDGGSALCSAFTAKIVSALLRRWAGPAPTLCISGSIRALIQ